MTLYEDAYREVHADNTTAAPRLSCSPADFPAKVKLTTETGSWVEANLTKSECARLSIILAEIVAVHEETRASRG